MKAICSLLLLQWIRAKSWILVLAGFAAVTVLAKYLVPWEIDPTLVPAARSQVVYALLFLVGLVLLPALYAEAGRLQLNTKQRLFWRAQGLKDGKYFVAVCLMCFLAAGLVVLTASFIIAVTGPGELSAVSLSQSMVLSFLAMIVCAPFAIGISQWLNSAPTALLTIVFNLVGYYGPGNINAARSVTGISSSEAFLWEVLYALIPQLRLGDQSERITFCWGPVPWSAAASASAYLISWILVSMCIGYVCWRRRT